MTASNQSTSNQAPESLQNTDGIVIRTLYEIASDAEVGFDEQARRILQLGCERFDLEIGILAHIQGDDYVVRQVISPEGSGMAPGDRFELQQTFCETTMRSNEPVAFEEAKGSEWELHPCYRSFRLEAYLGTQVSLGNRVYGTLNFSSPVARERKFHPRDLETVRLMASWIGGALHLDRVLREKQELITELEATLQRMERLEGILPICAACKKIRADSGNWEDVEHYIAARSEAQFSHGLCPTCVPDYFA